MRLGAEAALEERSKSSSAALGIVDPRAELERGPVAHVTLMAARELGDPVSVSVTVVADDCPLHPARVRRAYRQLACVARNSCRQLGSQPCARTAFTTAATAAITSWGCPWGGGDWM